VGYPFLEIALSPEHKKQIEDSEDEIW